MEIIRQEYIDKLLRYSKIKDIKIITGLRRSGKTTVLKQFISFIKTNNIATEENILTYDFNNRLLLDKLTWQNFTIGVIQKAKNKNTKIFLIIDEIQELKDWQKSIKTLFENDQINFDIYLTGSNSQTLSTDISTWFSGRHININLLPITFNDLVKYKILNFDKNDFKKYLEFGGLGKIIPFYDDITEMKLLLRNIINDAIFKDVYKRYKIKDKDSFEKTFKYIFDTIGNEISLNNISKLLKVNYRTTKQQIKWMCNANVINEINYYDVKGKRLLKTNSKYYSLDLGIIGSVNGFNKNFGWKLENLVYLDLLKKYEYVYTYKNKNGKQIDFICINDSIITYIQVTKYLVPKNEENSNWDREIGVLASIRDSNRKICICFENETERLDNGIEIINILDWL